MASGDSESDKVVKTLTGQLEANDKNINSFQKQYLNTA